MTWGDEEGENMWGEKGENNSLIFMVVIAEFTLLLYSSKRSFRRVLFLFRITSPEIICGKQ